MVRKKGAFDVIVFLLLLFFALICLLPLLNCLAISFSAKSRAALGEVYLIPKGFTLAPYAEILSDKRYFAALGVSFLRVLLGGGINVLLTVLTAYPLSKSKREFKARNVYMWVVVFTMLFNGGLIPNYMLIKELGLIDTIWALVLPGAVPVFNVIILMNFYKGIPKTLEEAAFVDGASPLYILIRIYIPLAKASIATITLFSVVNHWNAFFDGKIYINNAMKQPLQTYIQSLSVVLDSQALANMTPEEAVRKLELSDITFNAAKVVISMLPLLLIYPVLQKYFVKGVVMGAVKE